MMLFGKSFFSSFAPSTQYLALFYEISSMFEKEGSLLNGSDVPLKIRGATLTISSLSKTKVLVTANPHPISKALLIIGYEVAGGAEARPNGFANLTPARVDEISTRSIYVKNPGNFG